MEILSNIFYGMIFVSAMGSVFCLLSLLASHILGCTLPLWFSLCGMAFFLFPFLSPDVFFISPEKEEWFRGFYIACRIWIGGCVVLVVGLSLRTLLARRALKSCRMCDSKRIREACFQTAARMGLKKMPGLYWGTLDQPICVAGAVGPVILMNEEIVEKLTDTELIAVFFHELTHMQRRHILLERIYDCVCILNWPNPFVWIARREFSLHCETDCDARALKVSGGRLTQIQYASSVLRLLELSGAGKIRTGRETGALSFLFTKRRIKRILTTPSKIKTGIVTAALALCLVLMLIFSMGFSRQHFYPYPAYNVGNEYAAGAQGDRRSM